MSKQEYKYCSNCGSKMSSDSTECPQCGKKFNNSILEQLRPNETKIKGIKDIIINNMLYIHVAYLLVFFVGMASIKWGIILLVALILGMYYFSATNSESMSKLTTKSNDSKLSKDEPLEEVKKATIKTATVESAVEPVKRTETTHNSKKTPIIITIAAIVNLFGGIGGNFTQYTSESLYGILQTASRSLRYVSSYSGWVSSSVSSASSHSATMLMIASYMLFAIPILVIVFTWLKSRKFHVISLILIIIEPIGIFYGLSKAASVTGGNLNISLNEIFNLFGLPFYCLLIGLIAMFIFNLMYISKNNK